MDSYFAGYMWSLAATNGLDPQVLKELKKKCIIQWKVPDLFKYFYYYAILQKVYLEIIKPDQLFGTQMWVA